MMKNVEFIEGGLAVDDRGKLAFCNALDMREIKRFYQVTNHNATFVRAWHGHKREDKYIFLGKGAALVATVRVDDWDHPNKDAHIERFVLSEMKPGVVYVPGGHAHGFKTLTADTQLMFFSTSTLEESLKDDFRFDAYFWNPWEITER